MVWYLITGTVTDMRKLESALAAHQLDVANTYARRHEVDDRFDRFQDTLDTVKDSIGRIDVTISAIAAKMSVHPGAS